MIINKPGTKFLYNGIVYCVGDCIIGTDESEYAGLFGSILEIRDGEDKDTENETPDIYCSFEEPVLQRDIEALEKTFTDLYDEPKHLEDICLDLVIMAPEMIELLDSPAGEKKNITVYLVEEDWAIDGDRGYSANIFADYKHAKKSFNDALSEDLANGCSNSWVNDEDYDTDTGEDFFECWLDGEYIESHFKIWISKQNIQL